MKMTDAQKDMYLAERVATEMRQYFIEKKILPQDARSLDMDTLAAMVAAVGGTLMPIPEGAESEEGVAYVEKDENDDSFTIYYAKPESENHVPYLSVLHELGHAALHLDKHKKLACKGLGTIHDEADLFARTLAMPRQIFEQVAVENLENGTFNLRNIVKTYREDYFQILQRGQELKIWE